MFELHPRLLDDTYYVGDFPLCALLLSKDANYPWCILVPRVAGLSEIHQLDAAQRLRLLEESCLLSERLERAFAADKLNVAALGNVVPQLHIHHIVRYRTDAAWPRPVWGAVPAVAYSGPGLDAALARIVQALDAAAFTPRA